MAVQDKQLENGELPHWYPSITPTFASNADIHTEDTGNETVRRYEERKTIGGEETAFNTTTAVSADLALDKSMFRLGALLTNHNKFCQDNRNVH